ncbi:MAG: penicillin-binding transpeptidase domain-containing protein [Eubacteriales bacterium]|nr:penicillin-binding transpeptidase domain-containing protein [Eubacteriales bacterium]
MKQLIRNLLFVSVAFMVVFAFLVAGIVLQQNRSRENLTGHGGENKLALADQYARAGQILDRHGLVLASSQGGERTYASDPLLASSLVQTIGDYSHNIANTIEERYQAELTGSNRGLFKQFMLDLQGQGFRGADLRLTLDGDICRKSAELLQAYTASLVLLNYQSGEILALVNTPLVAPENVIRWENISEGSLFNKALLGQYTPGSTFKLITDAAWLTSDQFQADYQLMCKGREPLLGPGSVLENRQDAGHGLLDRRQALASSCNHYFGQLAVNIGSQQLLRTAENFAFNGDWNLGKLSVQPSRLVISPQLDDFTLSWLAIGQPLEGQELTVTPLHLAMISGAIAQGGQMMEPHLLAAVVNPGLSSEEILEPRVAYQVGSAGSMAILAQDMIYSVQHGMAQAAQIGGQIVGGKTGTAEHLGGEGKNQTNSLFTGFLQNPDHPLAIALVVEDQWVDVSSLAGQVLAYALDKPE